MDDLDITKSCRACMKTNVSLLDMFETVKIEEDNSILLANILMECTTAQVSKNDGLPQKLCNECVNLLQIMYTFRNQTAKAQKEFQRLLQFKSEVKKEFDVELKMENEPDYFESYDDISINGDYLKVESEDKVYECSICQKQYTREKRFLSHLASHNVPSLKCSYCDKSFHKQTSLDKHMTKHDNKCEVCNENFETKKLLNEHIPIHKGEGLKTEYNELIKYQCLQCEMSFPKHRSLAMHMKKHKNKENQKSFICDICGKEFSVKSLLKRHMKLHSELAYVCMKCNKRYSRQDQLMEHMNKHNGHKPNVCPYCNKGFSQLGSLKDHIRVHTGETPYLCSECGKGFSNSSNLRQHMMRHSGVKPYACNLCPKTFCTKGQMTSHAATHTGAHPYKCEQCGAAFTKPNSLKKHKFIHLGVRPFACDTCTMRFTCKDHLKRHQRIHTGEKPYRCRLCTRAFTQSNDMLKHLRTHLGQNLYQCSICGSSFRLLSELKQHYPVHFLNGNEGDHAMKTFEAIKPPEEAKLDEPKQEKENTEGRITITINTCDGNGLAGDITINIDQGAS